ncbi:hypothetical protein POM88_026069 [Heracleum sosnowskyi]|uniref:Uncharacterized protein n=1 Tax=Heracleum sosnowskyi TaxID=360622 RepID=A0AAD8I651_9APIA|nr:hypothetical protein POM88_026069 [Heracleum sosnowskyi]
MILGDGLYNFAKVLGKTTGLVKKLKNKEPSMILPLADKASPEAKATSFDDQCRTQLFLQDQIPSWLALGGYVLIASISTAVLPQIFHQLRWYYVLVIYIFAPVLAFCNAYGCGLTDWSLASTYGKLAIFTIGAWVGKDQGGVLAGLAACVLKVPMTRLMQMMMRTTKMRRMGKIR